MFESLRKHKRKLLLVGAAGAASYAAYRWWYAEPSEEEDDGGPSTSGGGSRGPLLNSRGSARTAQMDAEAHLQHHFDSIQEIADSTTVPSLLPALWRALSQAADVEALLERLRQAKEGSLQLSSAEKVATWEELKVAAFTRTLGAVWLLPLLDLFVRVQLNILGRHLYAESAATAGGGGSRGGGSSSAAAAARLSAPSQEQFLSYAEYLAQEGHAALVQEVHAAVKRALQGVALQQPLGAGDLAQIMSAALEGFAQAGGDTGWQTFLLPSPAALAASLQVRVPDNRAMLPGAEALLVDGEAVGQMAAEARAAAASRQFQAAVQACAKEVAREVAWRLGQQLEGQQALPLAKVIPLVAAVGQELMASDTPCIPALAQLEPVRALCSLVYSGGPLP